MPRRRGTIVAVKPAELVKPYELEEQVDINEPEEETMEEEIEYEEVEEEVEEEEEEEEDVEEEVEEEEEEVIEELEEEEEEEDPDEEEIVFTDGTADMTCDEDEEDENSEHAELLAFPPHGSEVYVGSIPYDASEEDLKSFCESVGEVTEVKLIKDKDSSQNKGYAFVTYRTKELATKAINDLNDTVFKGRVIRFSPCQSPNRLFISNVPKNWSGHDLKEALTDVGPGVIRVDLNKVLSNPTHNHGFTFVHYYNHACAEYSRKKMSAPNFKLGSNVPTVGWADSKRVYSSASSQVKSVYVKNLPKNVTQDQLKKLFECHGDITKVVLPPSKPGHEKRYAFVHFKERSMTMNALKNTEIFEINGNVLECSLAKPPCEKKVEVEPNVQKGHLQPNNPPRVGYSVMPGAYGALAPGFVQPVAYGAGQGPAVLAMVPMMLPDGRLVYALQQPGASVAQAPLVSNKSSSSSGVKNGGHWGRRYQPY